MPTIQNLQATLPELKIAQALDKLGIIYYFQMEYFGGRMVKGGFLPDFILPTYNISISVIGKYWHSTSDVRAKDRIQSISLMGAGIETIWIDEEDAMKDPEYFIKQAIRGISHSKLATGV